MMRWLHGVALAAWVGSALGCADEQIAPAPEMIVDPAWRALLGVPDHFELPAIPHYNLPSQEKLDLGRKLFHDERLSGNQTQSCASCHVQSLAFADGKKTPKGSTGMTLVRNSPGLGNAAYHATMSWANDALIDLEDLLRVPILGDDPIELGVTDDVRDVVLARFDDDPAYAAMFETAFPDSEEGATINKIIFALATFCRSLVTANSAFDRHLRGDSTALTDQQRLGFTLFNGERFECFHCHGGSHLSASYRDIHTPPGEARLRFFNTGLYNVDGEGSYPSHDQGLYDLTLDPNDRGLFRPPSLRNVGSTAPYMHDGSIATLREVVDFYAAGGRNVTVGPFAGDGRKNPLKSGLVRGFTATDAEIDAVVAFLQSLNDDIFVSDPAHAP